MAIIPHWKPAWVEVPITVTTDAYTANDVVGGTLSCDAYHVAGGGYIHAVKLIDDHDQAEPFKLYVFSEAPSTIANDAAHAPTEADWIKWVGTITIANTDYDQAGSEAAAMVWGTGASTPNNFVLFPNLANGKLYFRLVATDTPDYNDANDLTLYVALMEM